MAKPRRPPVGPAPSKVGKAVRLPNHAATARLQRVLDLVDAVHSPKHLKTLTVNLDRSVLRNEFVPYADTGPYEIHLNPAGDHLELALLHETGHYLEWQCIPKAQYGPREFDSDPLFQAWLQVVQNSECVQRIIEYSSLRMEDTRVYQSLVYLLRSNELWTRAYSQYIARKGTGHPVSTVLFQQIAAENQKVTGTIQWAPYWPQDQFAPIETAMDQVFQEIGWAE